MDKPGEPRDATDKGRPAENAAARQAAEGSTRTVERAEPRSRHQYAANMRAEDATHDGGRQPDGARNRDNGKDGGAALHPSKDDKHAREQRNSPDREHPSRGTSSDRRPDQAAIKDQPVGDSRARTPELAEPRSRHEYARAARAEGARGDAGESGDAGRAGQPYASPEEHKGQPESASDQRPAQQDRQRAQDLYQDWLKEQSAGRERGSNIVGDKPDRSPGDISDLPPTGEQLLTIEKEDASRAEKFGRELTKDYGDVIDTVSKNVTSIEQILARPQPTGHPEIAVPAGSQTRLDTPQHGTLDPSAIAEMGLVTGIVLFRAGQWVRQKITQRRGG
ncbi:MAG: hypothetical protein JO345_33055 [Streptosporangiaceae bacterium]|nr:hypothetical protein [Streptosporangiaceae bacterium]